MSTSTVGRNTIFAYGPLAPAMALVAALGARAALVTTFGLLARLRAAPDRSPT